MKGKKTMVGLVVFVCIVAFIMVWFMIPYSPLKGNFLSDSNDLKLNLRLFEENDMFTQEDFADKPVVIQKYMEHCGYIGKNKMNYVRMEYIDVDFKQGRSGPNLKMDYTQYNYVKDPARIALIQSSMFGIPFQGYDYYSEGTGGMKGVIAKMFTLFDQKGPEMDKACLVTFLAESMFVPSVLLQDYIQLEEINDFQVKATITYRDQVATGVFTFNDEFEMISFTTEDRAVIGTDGSIEYVPWSAVCGNYVVGVNGINQPTTFKAIWNYPDEDFVYFDGCIKNISYE